MQRETAATTILSGVIGIPMIRVVSAPQRVIKEVENQVQQGMQQEMAGRFPEEDLKSLQALQRAQRLAALGR